MKEHLSLFLENNIGNKDKKHPNKQIDKRLYNQEQGKMLILWLSGCSLKLQIAVMERINPSPYKSFLSSPEARLQALFKAIDEVRSSLELTGRKNQERNIDALDAAHALRVDLIRSTTGKRSPKREKLWLHKELIHSLNAKGLSLRQICEYLKRYCGLEVNHTYLRRCGEDMGIKWKRRKSPAGEKDGTSI